MKAELSRTIASLLREIRNEERPSVKLTLANTIESLAVHRDFIESLPEDEELRTECEEVKPRFKLVDLNEIARHLYQKDETIHHNFNETILAGAISITLQRLSQAALLDPEAVQKWIRDESAASQSHAAQTPHAP